MHEVSLICEVLAAVADSAGSNGLARVFKVGLVVGTEQMVLPEALQFAFDQLKRAPLAPEAVLEIEARPGRELLIAYLEGE